VLRSGTEVHRQRVRPRVRSRAPGPDRLVAGYEKWLTARAAEGPLRHVATRNQPAAEPPPPAPDVSRGIVASPTSSRCSNRSTEENYWRQ
jgi:hypothetical protein